jgi:hypothetical protein
MCFFTIYNHVRKEGETMISMLYTIKIEIELGLFAAGTKETLHYRRRIRGLPRASSTPTPPGPTLFDPASQNLTLPGGIYRPAI